MGQLDIRTTNEIRAALAAPDAPTPAVLIPETPMMRKQTYSATLSYVGSSRRLWTWTRGWGNQNLPMAVLAWSVFVFSVAVAWAVVTVWYAFTVVLFGWFLFPFRLIRRSSRKQEALQRQQLATMQAIMVQQQQALAANSRAADND